MQTSEDISRRRREAIEKMIIIAGGVLLGNLATSLLALIGYLVWHS
jgi:hypothetical protein